MDERERIKEDYENKSPEELRRDIAQTRVRIDDTIEQLKGHLSAGHLKDRFMDELRSVGKAGSRFRDTGSSLVDRIREHPFPAALAGTGLIFLFASSAGDGVRVSEGEGMDVEGAAKETAEGISGKAEELKSRAYEKKEAMKGKASETARLAGDKARHAKSVFDDLIQNNPLAVMAAAFAIGSALGLSIPETRAEAEAMGEAAASVKEKAAEEAEKTEEDIGRAA